MTTLPALWSSWLLSEPPISSGLTWVPQSLSFCQFFIYSFSVEARQHFPIFLEQSQLTSVLKMESWYASWKELWVTLLNRQRARTEIQDTDLGTRVLSTEHHCLITAQTTHIMTSTWNVQGRYDKHVLPSCRSVGCWES